MSRVQSSSHTAQENDARRARRNQRWAARRLLGFKSSLRRVRYCGRDLVPGKGGVAVLASGLGKERRAGFGNVQHCGSTWACPVCSGKIAAARAAEIARVISAWHAPVFGPQLPGIPVTGLFGGRIIFLTLTMRHKKGQPLAELWENGISAGWGKVTSGRAWKREQELYGVRAVRTVKSGKRIGETVTEQRIGFARVVETTHGDNGWHVHIHALLFVRGDMTGKEALALGDSMFGRWAPALKAAGFGTPSLVHGVDVRLMGPADGDALSKYFAKSVYGQENAGKAGWEAAGGTGKNGSKKFGNRTPFQILADIMAAGDADASVAAVAAAGSGDDLAIWWEWETASKGKRQLTWSPWLRDLLRLPEEETDQAIADAAILGDIVLTLRQDQWDAVFPSAAVLLDLVESDNDGAAARAWLDEKLGNWMPVAVYSGPLCL
mgnify:CR=1 FL=1